MEMSVIDLALLVFIIVVVVVGGGWFIKEARSDEEK